MCTSSKKACCHQSTIKTACEKACKGVTHVIFDLDGLLIDSESVSEQVIREIAQSYGKEYTVETKMKVLGTPETVMARTCVEDMQLPVTPEQFAGVYRSKCLQILADCKLMPGAERLVQHLYNNKIPIAIATSSAQEMVTVKTEKRKDIFNLFHHTVCAGSDPEVKNGKPAPDVFLICASRFPDSPKPEKCLVLEDAPNGIQAAIAAGMQAVMVPAKEVSAEKRKGATLVLESLLDFKPEVFGLPPFKS